MVFWQFAKEQYTTQTTPAQLVLDKDVIFQYKFQANRR
jgi:hypothetical protein